MIQLRRAYDYEVFPAVWDKVGDMADSGLLLSIEDVYEELKAQDDLVFDWAKKHSKMFLPLDKDIQSKASQILSTHPGLVDLKKRKSGADPFVIATGLVHSCAIVTEEVRSMNPARPKIPDVCKAYRLECIRLLEMLRNEHLKLARI